VVPQAVSVQTLLHAWCVAGDVEILHFTRLPIFMDSSLTMVLCPAEVYVNSKVTIEREGEVQRLAELSGGSRRHI